MKREIKFRVWDTKAKAMSEPFALFGEFTLLGGVHDWQSEVRREFCGLYELADLEVMQNTGLKDKNGKEIYEGDILYDPDCFGIITGGDNNPSHRQVIWNDGEAKFELAFISTEEYAKTFRPSGRFLCARNFHTYSVIGDIYQNPELLK